MNKGWKKFQPLFFCSGEKIFLKIKFNWHPKQKYSIFKNKIFVAAQKNLISKNKSISIIFIKLLDKYIVMIYNIIKGKI